MASRKPKRRGEGGMGPFKVGLIAAVILILATGFAFTKFNPFADPYEFKATFENASNLKPRSPVRIAGVDVGEVKKVEPIAEEDAEGSEAALVTIEMKEKGLPIHEDAELHIRPRIFLEGNFFVDLEPGSPSAPELEKGATVGVGQTSAPVQFGDILIALQKDTREDLQTLLQQYAEGLVGPCKGQEAERRCEYVGARGFRGSIKYWEPAYKYSALANEATLGEQPERDLNRLMRGQAKTFRALSEDEESLKDLVTNFNTTAAAFAREDAALEASIPLLRDTLRAAQPALGSLNDALPSLRAFARDALPGTLSSNATLRESLPFITQARLLFRPEELRGAARELRRQTPGLVRFNEANTKLLGETRQVGQCTIKVLVPFVIGPITDPDFPENSGSNFLAQANRGLVGLSGESRMADANNQWFHGSAVGPPQQPGIALRPAPPPDLGRGSLERRPDVPCETQEAPNMNAPGATLAQVGGPAPKIDVKAQARAWQKAYPLLKRWDRNKGDGSLKNLEDVSTSTTAEEAQR